MKWAVAQERQQFAFAKTKALISCAVTAQLISAFVLTNTDSTTPFLLKSRFQAYTYDCAGWFVSDLFGKPDYCFTHGVMHK